MRIVCAVLFACGVACAQDVVAPEHAIRAALANRVDTAGNSVGIVVGVLTPDGRKYIAHGLTSKTDGSKPDGNTIFEIGSITKIFTSLLLADMAERGEVKLDGPISAYLPRTVAVPRRNGKEITLADLATHTSGLPRDAGNMDLAQLKPFATYGPDQLYAFLSGYTLTRNPGDGYQYSNVGAMLLAHILALRAGMSYEALLKARILDPLGMTSTTVTLSGAQRRRTAAGYDSTLQEIPLWEVDAIVGAGSIRSTAADMLTFAAAWLGFVENPLKAAMHRMVAITRPSGTPSMTLHAGWGEFQIGGGILFSNGRRGGYSSAFAIRPSTQSAAIALSNSVQGVDDLALHAVYPKRPLMTFNPPPVGVQLDEGVLDSYTGVYEFAPAVSIRITREGKRLFGQVTGQGRFEMFADKAAEFSVAVVNAQIRFVADDAGAITALVLRQNGIEQRAQKAGK